MYNAQEKLNTKFAENERSHIETLGQIDGYKFLSLRGLMGAGILIDLRLLSLH